MSTVGDLRPLHIMRGKLTSKTAQARNMVKTVQHPACGEMKLVNTPVKYSDSEPSIRTPPPLLGQHTDEVLRDLLGMKREEISKLKAEGVVAG